MSIHTTETEQTQFVHRWRWIPLVVGVLVILVISQLTGWFTLDRSFDINQARLNRALSAPQSGQSLQQTFTPLHDGLSQVELIVVNHDEDLENETAAVLMVLDETGQPLAQRTLQNNKTAHNQTVKLSFPPQEGSKSKRYTIVMTGSDDNRLALWGYTLPIFDGETLTTPDDPGVQTLHFTTRYTLTWRSSLAIWSQQIGRYFIPILVILSWLVLPGLIVSKFIVRDSDTPSPFMVRCGLAFGLGVAIWPLIWYWWSFIGRFSSAGLWSLYILGWFYLLASLVWDIYTDEPSSGASRFNLNITLSWSDGLFGLFLIAVLLLRFLTVRDLQFLPWVDSSRHALITAVFADAGYWTNSYEPYLPVTDGFYHYGFHTLSASLHLMFGEMLPLNELLLILMQVMSVLVCLSLFTAGWLLTKQKGVAWSAPFLIAIPFLFPSYYTTWGRLTQLTGVFLLPLILAFTWRILCQLKGAGSRKPQSLSKLSWARPSYAFIFLALSVASLALIHMRVFLLYLPAVFVFALFAGRRLWQNAIHLAGTGLLSFLLISPRIWHLGQLHLARQARRASGDSQPPIEKNAFPLGYLTTGWERWFWMTAGVCLTLILIYLLIAWWGRKRGLISSWLALDIDPLRVASALALWAGIALFLTAGANIHPRLPVLLPEVTLNSTFIILFLPLSLVLAITAVSLHHWLAAQHPMLHLSLYLVWGGGLASLTLFGVTAQINILNDTTLLGRPADVAALEWIAENTPPDAVIAHNSWRWLHDVWAGVDGGAWLTPLTGRASSTPPIDHIYNRELAEQVQAFNPAVHAIDDWSTPAAATFLRNNEIDYIFIGERTGDFDPAKLIQNPAFVLVYRQDGAFIFQVSPPPSGS